MSKHVFLSFVVEDKDAVELFRGQAKNKNSGLAFDDYSVRVPYNSTDADYIRRQISAKIKNSSVTICIVGATTHTSAWVKWEIEKSVAEGNKVIGVKLSTAGPIPSALTAARAPIYTWNIADIVAAIG